MISLLHGKENPSLNLFIDSTYDNSVRIGILSELSSCRENLTVLCYHSPASTYKERLDGDSKKLRFHDFYSDPLHWFSESPHKSTKIVDSTIFIDDLMLFGLSHNCVDHSGRWDGIVDLLLELSARNSVFVFVNPDLVAEADLRCLLHTVQFHMHINSDLYCKLSYNCKSLLKKTSGKLIAKTIILQLDEYGRLCSFQEDSSMAIKQCAQESSTLDPASNLTFNLHLTDSEKQARASIALPYILNESSKSAYLGNQISTTVNHGGNVIYVPDDADDFDDEDPDDDLDV